MKAQISRRSWRAGPERRTSGIFLLPPFGAFPAELGFDIPGRHVLPTVEGIDTVEEPGLEVRSR
jgi:hypothetical protein